MASGWFVHEVSESDLASEECSRPACGPLLLPRADAGPSESCRPDDWPRLVRACPGSSRRMRACVRALWTSDDLTFNLYDTKHMIVGQSDSEKRRNYCLNQTRWVRRYRSRCVTSNGNPTGPFCCDDAIQARNKRVICF